MKKPYNFYDPANWELYAKSQPTIGPKPDDWTLWKQAAYNREVEVARTQQAFGMWLTTLPFSFTPTRAPVRVGAPNYRMARPKIYSSHKDLKGMPILLRNSRPLIDTKARYTSKRMAETWDSEAPQSPTFTKIDFNQPVTPHFPPTIPPILRAAKSPEAKLAALGMMITLAAKAGSVLAPEPVKAALPPDWRALGHYLAGSGKPSSVNLKHTDIAPEYRGGEVLLDRYRYADYEAGLYTALEHPIIKNLVANPEAVRAMPMGPGAVTTSSNRLTRALGKFYYDPISDTYFDDYRFYPLGKASKARQLDALRLMFKSAPVMYKDMVKGTTMSHPTAFEDFLSGLGKPFPVVIPPPR